MRKYEVDFWGYLTSCSSGKRFFNKMFKIFVWKFKHRSRFVRYLLRKHYWRFNYPRLMSTKKKRVFYNSDYIVNLHDLLRFRVYYGDMTIVKFKKYLKRINRRRFDFETSICFLLETRLDILLFRLNFVKTPKEARQYIKCKKIKINDKIVKSLNYQLCIHDIITFEKDAVINFLARLTTLINNKQILFNYPKYLEMSFSNMKCMLISYPKRKYIPTTWNFNLNFLDNL